MIETLLDRWRTMGLPAWCEHKYGWICEDGRPIVLTDWQKAVVSEYWQRRGETSTLVISTTKKAGKTTISSLILAYRWLTIEYPGLHFAINNDASQSEELQVNMITNMVKRHPILSKHVKVTRSELTFLPTGARLMALPQDWQGSGGTNFATCSFSELWGFAYESGFRVYEELTPIPGVDCLRLIDSYAGFEGESELFRQVWDRGLSGERVNADWPIYRTGGQLSYIHQGPDAQARCWRGEPSERAAYYREQEATLRPSSYKRLHLNQWQTGVEDTFVQPESWENCYDAGVQPVAAGDRAALVLGLDLAAGAKGGDTCSLVGVTRWGPDAYAVRFVRCWKPPARGDFDYNATVIPAIDWLVEHCNPVCLCYDPFQAVHLVRTNQARWLLQSLKFGQQSQRTLADSGLYQAILGRTIRHYNDPVLTKHIRNAAAKVSGENHIRIVKASRWRKVDAAVALSMALWTAKALNLPVDPSYVPDKAALPQMSVAPATPELLAIAGRDPVKLRYTGAKRGTMRITLRPTGRVISLGAGSADFEVNHDEAAFLLSLDGWGAQLEVL